MKLRKQTGALYRAYDGVIARRLFRMAGPGIMLLVERV
jgi:hypothetical protein